MKKFLTFLILLLIALIVWDALLDPFDMAFHIGDEDFDGPLGALAALVFAGGGLLIGTVVALFVGLVLAVVFAGVGILLVAALGLGALLVTLAISPLLLPILIPIAIAWFFVSRARRNRLKTDTQLKAEPV